MKFAPILAVLLLAQSASAQPDSGSGDEPTPVVVHDTSRAKEKRRAHALRIPIVLVENSFIIAPPLYYYWNTVDQQKEDWELNWTWQDWKTKLFSTDDLVLDTNRFEANALRHPLAGALAYQVGRANGLGPLGSTLLDFGNAVLWEYVAEYREKPAINDLFANTAAGILVGEPLFQLGNLADRRPTLLRRGFSLIASPFHRAQREVHLSPLDDAPVTPNHLEAIFGTAATRHGKQGLVGEMRVGLDLEMVTDPAFGLPGEEVRYVGLAEWNRVSLDLRAAGDGLTGGRFRSYTTFWGRTERSLDEMGRGQMSFLGFGGGFEANMRNLSGTEQDRYAVFQLANPRVGAWWRTPYGDLDVELGGSGDVAMVQSLARLDMPLLMDSSVVLTRGYYYATGLSANARLRARRGAWTAELESVAHQFWSYDDHTYGGDNDPKDLADGRVMNTAAIGVRPTAADVHVELFGNANFRRGTASNLWRDNKEMETGVALRAGF